MPIETLETKADLAAFQREQLDKSDVAAKTRALGGRVRRLEALIVRGEVDAAGAVVLGSGFSSVRNAAGNYTVTFDIAFDVTPVVVPGAAITAGPLAVKVTGVSASAFTVQVFNSTTGANADGEFTFVVVAV